MNKNEELSQAIATVERQISEAKSEVAKKALNGKLERLKEELKSGAKKGTSTLATLSSARKSVRKLASKDFTALIEKLSKKPEYAFLKGYSEGKLKDDLARVAKPMGYRFYGENTKKPTIPQIKKGLKNGTVYYEKRPRHSDVSRVVQLKEGGSVGKKLMVGTDDFSFLLDLSDRELSNRLDLIQDQQKRNGKQYMDAFQKKENTSKIEEARKRLDDQESAIIEARIRVKKMSKGGGVEDCIDYIKNSESIRNNGYYLHISSLNNYVDSGAKIPQIKPFCLITFNSGGQKNLKAIDTINATLLSSEIAKLLNIDIELARIIVSEQTTRSKRFTMDMLDKIKNNNIIVADRETIVCTNLSNKYATGGNISDKEIKLATTYGKMLNDLNKQKQFNKKIEQNAKVNSFAKANGITIDNNNIIYVNGSKVAFIDKINQQTGQDKLNWVVKKFDTGGRIDLFEDYENIPANIQEILDKYSDAFGGDGSDMDYKDTANMLKEFEAEGYTFDYGLDNEPFGLRPIGVKLNELRDYEDFDDDKMAKGGGVDSNIEFRKLAKSNNFDIVVAEGRYEVELDANDKVKSIVHPNGNRHKASECPIYNKYKKEINHYIMKKYAEGGNIASFNWKNFTLKELSEALPTDVEIVSYDTPTEKDQRPYNPKNKKFYTTKKLTIGIGEAEISRGDENIYLEITCYDADNKSSEEYEVKIYSKENHKGLKEVANAVIEKMKHGGTTKPHKIGFYIYETKRIFILWKGIKQPFGHFFSAKEALEMINKVAQTKKEKLEYKIYTPDGTLDVADFIDGDKMATGGTIDNSYLGRTSIGKSFYGWKAETSTTKKIKGYDWEITTMKRYGGELVSTATGGKSMKQDGYSTFEYSPFEDPNYSLVRSKPKMVNEKAVTKQHEEALKIFIEKMNEMSGEIMAKGGGIEAPKYFKNGGQTYTWLNVTKMKSLIRFNNKKEAQEAKKILNNLNDEFTYHLVEEGDKFVIYRDFSKDEFLLNIINSIGTDAELVNVSSMKKEGSFESETEARKKFESLSENGSKTYYLLTDGRKNTFYVYSDSNKSDKLVKEIMATGGLIVNNDKDLKEVAEYMTTAVKKHRWDLKDLIYYFEKENGYDYTHRVKIWEDMNGYEMKKTYENIYEMLKRIVEANGKKMKHGGSVKAPIKVKKRLEAIRKSIQNENVSYGEMAELQSLSKYIDPSDIELREAAGMPEFEDDDDKMATGGSVGFKEDISATKEVIKAFFDKYGDVLGITESEALSKVEEQDYLGRGASSFNFFSVSSNIGDKLAQGQTKPTRGYIKFSSDINPNGVTGKDDVARTYVIDVEIKGRKRLTLRSYDEEGKYFKSYAYGRTVEELLEKISIPMLQLLKGQAEKDGLKFSSVKAEGGSIDKVKVGQVITSNTGVPIKVVAYDPLFGGRIKGVRMDEYGNGKESQWMPIKKFKFKDGGKIGEYIYLPNEDISKIVLKSKQVIGEDRILDGAYIKGKLLKGAKTKLKAPKTLNAIDLVAELKKFAKENFADQKFGEKKDYYFTVQMVQKLIDAGYNKKDITALMFGIDAIVDIKSDTEFTGYIGGIAASSKDYKDQEIDRNVEAIKTNTFELGLKYPDFDWSKIVKKYNISLKYVEVKHTIDYTSESTAYVYGCFVGENIVIGTTIKRERYKGGKLYETITDDYTDVSKINGQFNKGYWGIVSSQKDIILDVADMLFSQAKGYCKDVSFFYNNLGGVDATDLIENKIKFADGGNIDVWNLKKGDKIRTRKGDIETIERKIQSGYFTKESEYSHPFEGVEFVSRPSKKMATGGGVDTDLHGKFGDDNPKLVNFDVDDLDEYETMVYNDFSKKLGKARALQILINNVEGDYTQLSPELAEIAEEQVTSEEWDEESNKRYFAEGGGVNVGKYIVTAYDGKSAEFSLNKKGLKAKNATDVAYFDLDEANKFIEKHKSKYYNMSKFLIRERTFNDDVADYDDFVDRETSRKLKEQGRKMAKGGGVSPYYGGMSEAEILKATVVYDNGGETLDRYTVFTPDSSVFGMSATGDGFNQYIGDDTEIEKGSHLGKRLKTVPKDIKSAVLNRMKEEFGDGGSMYKKGGNTNEDLSGNYFSSTDFVETHNLKGLAKETFGDNWESGGDYDFDEEEIRLLIKKLGGGYKVIFVDSEDRDAFEEAKANYFPKIKNKSNDGDLFVIPTTPKFKKGGNTGYTYVPNADIEKIVGKDGKEYGQKMLLDGAYVKDKVRTPKMSRTQFEDDVYAYGSGGNLGKSLYVANSSFFDYNTYDTNLITDTLKAIGAKNIRLERERPNSPEVVVFNGDKQKAKEALNSAFDTETILIYEKDFRKSKFKNGGGVDYYELQDLKNQEYLLEKKLNELVDSENEWAWYERSKAESEIDRVRNKISKIESEKFENGGAIEVRKMKKEKEKMVSELFEKCGVFFAFSEKQFEENKTPLKEGEKYVSIGGGGYLPKGKVNELTEGMEAIERFGKQTVKKKNLVEAEILDELQNHECFYTGDISDVVDLFEGTYTKQQIRDVYNKHREANQEYALGGEITAEEREQALKNSPKLNF